MPNVTQQSYEEEQKRLKNEYEGKSQDIHITIPQEPEVNPEVYKDVEPMLYRGFLTVAAEINKVYFVFKSLNHHEFGLLQFSGVLQGKKLADNFWSFFLAYGVFMVDGMNVLSDRERWISKLADTFSELPKDAQSKIIRHISEINRRSSAAIILTEAYAMESMSRYRWMQIKGIDLTSPAVTGIDGTQRIGLNWAQQLWRALNLAEDRNEQYEREWENAKFVGSCFAGKGLSKVYSQDTERRRKEREERITRKDKLLREVLLGEKVPEKTTMLPGMTVTVPHTVEELVDQLEKDLRGEQDYHDKVVAEHENKIREQYQERQRQQEEAIKETSVRFGGKNVIGGSEIYGLTPQEVELRMQRGKQLEAQAAARMQVHPLLDEKTEVFLDKWGVTGPEITTEISTTDRDISNAVPLPQPRGSTASPFRKK